MTGQDKGTLIGYLTGLLDTCSQIERQSVPVASAFSPPAAVLATQPPTHSNEVASAKSSIISISSEELAELRHAHANQIEAEWKDFLTKRKTNWVPMHHTTSMYRLSSLIFTVLNARRWEN